MFSLMQKIDLSLLGDDKVAVGVSGGADSLALVLLLNELLGKKRIVALTVDHGLRKESSDEAYYVAQVMKKLEIEHHILIWEGKKPAQGIEEAARNARYNLIYEWCKNNGVHVLCVAHHLLDQVETFFIRLHRGSGLIGLCGMSAVGAWKDLRIVRPLLDVHPQELKVYLTAKNVHWVDDPSNQSDDFLRCRIRKFLPLLEDKVGITPERIGDTMKVLARSRNYIRSQVESFVAKYVRFWDEVGVCISLKALRESHEELVYQVLNDLLKKISGKDYTPRADDVERLVIKLTQQDNENFSGATLSECELFVAQHKLWIVREVREKEKMPKKVWEVFVKENSHYSHLELPYKLRVALVKNKMPIVF